MVRTLSSATSPSRPVQGWQLGLAAGFPSLVALQLALHMYVVNGAKLVAVEQQLTWLLWGLLLGWIVLFAGLTWCGRAGKATWALAVALVGFFLIREVAFPLPLGELDGNTRFPRMTSGYRTGEWALLAALAIGLSVVRLRWTAKLAGIASCIFAVSSLATLIQHHEVFPWSMATAEAARNRPLNISSIANRRPDIYQILFDEYQTVEHLFFRQERGPAPFDDFICFKNNIANYNHTWLSLPSLLNGRLYPPDMDVRKWFQSFQQQGLVKSLKDNGYQIHIHGYGYGWWHNSLADNVRSNYDVSKEWLQGRPGRELIYLMGMRTLPSSLGKRLHPYRQKGGSLPDIPPATDLPFYSTVMFREMVRGISRTSAGGNYTFVHLILPHGPQVMDAEGNYVGSGKGTRLDHVFLVEKLVAELIAELKRLDRYDESLIVIHADTGSYYDPNIEQQAVTRNGALKTADSQRWTDEDKLDGARWPLPIVQSRASAALLFKPPRHRGYRVESAPSQLLDIPPTILGAVGLNEAAGHYREGGDLLTNPPDLDRLRKTYVFGKKVGGQRQAQHMQEYSILHGQFQRGPLVYFTGKPY